MSGSTKFSEQEILNDVYDSTSHSLRTVSSVITIAANDATSQAKGGSNYVCDGVDDNVQIQAAIDSLPDSGGTVQLSEGSFSISSPIVIDNDAVHLMGQGMAATTISLATGAKCDMIYYNTSDVEVTGTASAGGNTTLTDASKSWTTNAYAGRFVKITSGTGAGQSRLISSNTATVLTVSVAWFINPSNDSVYGISESPDLFSRIEGITWYGNAAINAAETQSAATNVSVSANQTTDNGTSEGGGTSTQLVDSDKSWTTNQWANWQVKITGGTGAGQSRRIASNNATILTVDTAWVQNPANDSTYTISIGGLTLVDSGKNWTTNQWVNRSVEIVSGYGAGQIRRIISNTATTLTLDDSWYQDPDNACNYSIAGHGFAAYGYGTFDLQLNNTWFDNCAGWGVYIEQAWGMVCYDLISEYNLRGGMYINLSPEGFASSQTTQGPKIVNSKLLANSGDGLYIKGYVYNTIISTSEFGSTSSTGAGIRINSAKGVSINNCRFVSFDNLAESGVSIENGALNVSIVSCNFGGSNTAGPQYGIWNKASGGQHLTGVGNTFALGSSYTPVKDEVGRSTWKNNVGYFTTAGDGYNDETAGTVTVQRSGATAYVTFNPKLGNPAPVGTIMCMVQPYNAAAAAIGPWIVSNQAYNSIRLTPTSPIADATDYAFMVHCWYQDRDKVPSAT